MIIYRSQLLFSICQKLLHFQLNNVDDVLRWLKSLMHCRKSFLIQNKQYALYGCNDQMTKQAAVKLEVVCCKIMIYLIFVRLPVSSHYGQSMLTLCWLHCHCLAVCENKSMLSVITTKLLHNMPFMRIYQIQRIL